ncbi:MAG: rhomboid family intramembrane serine protease [Bacteroidales bacterium]|nr:rhomboid family intramembrane serine protease [Bacteroidales bacterium]
MDNELRKILRAGWIPVFLSILMVIGFILSETGTVSLRFFSVYPLKINGLQGVGLSIFGHSDTGHLISNLIPFFILGWALFYYYRDFAFKSLIMMWLLSGLWVWLFARNSYHVGASGVVYALAFFHVTSALIRRVFALMAFAALIFFLYGGLVWGFFPEFFPERNISWESHLMGAIAGVVVAWYYRKSGPQRTIIEDDDDDSPDWFEEVQHDFNSPPLSKNE